MVVLVNYTQLNNVTEQYPTLVFVLLKVTLIVILLQSAADFFLGILELALRADDLNRLKVGNSTNLRIVSNPFRKFAECSFHFEIVNFLWKKLFGDRKNILGCNHVLLEAT